MSTNIPKQNIRDCRQPNKIPSDLLFDKSDAFATDKSLHERFLNNFDITHFSFYWFPINTSSTLIPYNQKEQAEYLTK